jgi:ESSS subunit of NADH:ubiquinone oxidoreductase (complex I)
MLLKRLALAPPLRRSLLTSTRLSTRTLSTTAPRLSEGDHADEDEPPYDPPGGWLWGIPPGEKYEKEGWENLFWYGFYGSLGVAGVAYCFKPDTS